MGRATRDGTREDEATHLDTTPITFECSRAAENIPCGGVAARRRVNAPDDACGPRFEVLDVWTFQFFPGVPKGHFLFYAGQ